MEYFFVAAAYLLGAVPFGLLIGKAAGVDVRTAGSRNIGATNVGRLLGRKLGISTLACDIVKAIVPMIAVGYFLAGRSDRELWVALCGFAAFVGHLFPVYLRFKGGKGVATALGVFIYLAPAAVLADVVVFVVVVYLGGYVSLGSLAASLVMPLLVWVLYRSAPLTLMAGAIALLVWIKHRDNISRLLRHEEKSWRREKKSGDQS